MNNFYIVWIGGVLDYEGHNLSEANNIFNKWVSKNYDDVILETAQGKILRSTHEVTA